MKKVKEDKIIIYIASIFGLIGIFSSFDILPPIFNTEHWYKLSIIALLLSLLWFILRGHGMIKK